MAVIVVIEVAIRVEADHLLPHSVCVEREDQMRLAEKLASPSLRWLMLALTIGLVIAVGLSMVFSAEDADAKKKKKKRAVNYPPSYTFVLCAGGPVCDGTTGPDLMVGSTASEDLRGAAGNDIYMGGGDNDLYTDESTSSDLYGGFRDGEFPNEGIHDSGGIDVVDLTTSVNAYASYHFTFRKIDQDGDGASDDLNMSEEINGGTDDIFVYNHFGPGQIEYIKFTDKIVYGANIPGLIEQ
jgi:hypothetical protein